MALPPEVQTLRTLLQRREDLRVQRAALDAADNKLSHDFDELFLSGTLGVSEGNRYRLVHVRTRAGKVQLLLIFFTGNVNGINTADAQILEIPEETAPEAPSR